MGLGPLLKFFWDESNVAFPIIEQGLLPVWQRSLSSKYHEMENLGSRLVETGQIFFHWLCAGLNCWLQITFLLIGVSKNQRNCIITHKNSVNNYAMQQLCNQILIFTTWLWILCWLQGSMFRQYIYIGRFHRKRLSTVAKKPGHWDQKN